ncbi:hypothetical protein FSP39_007667 [Pinctada imbricata]|uniref:protein-tyrosine-phosphatase n=1 Tax=Pinctada imbricata TaxID=66713 RepID=A0AA88YAY5_PINIB|nr:hypothetical protein FSP39_007667 [Pinctada imbricata]
MDDKSEVLVKNLRKFINHVDEMSNEDNPSGNGFNREYIELREIAAANKQENRFPAEAGKLPYNIKKNRYKDIIPFDEQRVVLEEVDGVEGSDYINASLIMSIHNNEAYIASQGPLPHTVNDFWRMVWEQNVKVIMMACKEVEANKKKCARYWPESKEKEVRGKILVELLEDEAVGSQNDCFERKMSVSHEDSNEMRIVTQYHYTGWPDHGIPDDIDVIMEMMARMRDIRSHDKDFAPVVVHCSAGCGRTGTICAIDYAWEVLKSGNLDEEFSMYEIVHYMREQRQSMIQTPDQYEMAHLCVRWLFEKHIEVIEENIYANFESVTPTQDVRNEVGPYETVGGGGFNNSISPAFSIQSKKPCSNQSSLLEKECLSTIDTYVNKDSESVQKPTVPSKKPELTAKPLNDLSKERREIVEQEKDSKKPKELGKSKGYENVIEKDSYENVGNSDSSSVLKLGTPISNVEKQKSVLPERPDSSPKSKNRSSVGQKSGPSFVSSVAERKSGPSFVSSASEQKSGPSFVSSATEQKSGPAFVSSVPEKPIPTKSGPLFEESGPSVARPKSNQLQKQTSLQGQNVTRITVGDSNKSRISYIGNPPPIDNTYSVAHSSSQNQPKVDKQPAPTKPQRKSSLRNSSSSDQPKTPSDPGNVYSFASHPEVDNKSKPTVNGMKESEAVFRQEPSEGAVYSQVSFNTGVNQYLNLHV